MLTPMAVSAPAPAPETFEAAFVQARALARAAADPASVLSDGSATLEQKLDALDAVHDRIPNAKSPVQVASLDALAAAALDRNEPPEFHAKALTMLGYAVPPVISEAARGRAVRVLLAALAAEPAYRLYVLRGLGPAAHGLPQALEPDYEKALLDLLAGPVKGEERGTALVALNGFVSGGEEFPKRAPDLLRALDARLLAPIEADPAAFVRDPRWSATDRELAAAILWMSARHRQTDGDPAPAGRVRLLLDRLSAAEPDAGARAWYETYRTAASPKSGALTERTTRRAPSGRGEPEPSSPRHVLTGLSPARRSSAKRRLRS